MKAYIEEFGESDSLLNAQQQLDKSHELIEVYGGGLRGLGVLLGLWESSTDIDEEEMESRLRKENGDDAFEGTSWDYIVMKKRKKKKSPKETPWSHFEKNVQFIRLYDQTKETVGW